MSRRAAWALLLILLAVRLPSLVQPAGSDQDLYAYVGQEIARGGLPYRDAWDQKPPAIHYTYAALYAIWPHESVVAAADLAVSAAIAILLVMLERRLTGGPGFTSALVFLLLGNPVYSRMGGIWLRSQCETFIALAVTGSMLCAHHAAVPSDAGRRRVWLLRGAAGLLIGIATAFKYNAAVYGLALTAATTAWRYDDRRSRPGWRADALRDAAGMAAGAAVPLAIMIGGFAAAGLLDDLWQATVLYNLKYSGETYAGAADIVRYAATFPIQRARVDGLWLLGGAGCLVLLGSIRRAVSPAAVIAWLAGACVVIVINGGRGLPQYFVQANPALAMAAGLAAWVIYRRLRSAWMLAAVVAMTLLALSRVVPVRKAAEATLADARYAAGAVTPDQHLARFGGQRPGDKHVPAAVRRLAQYISRHSTPADTVYICGYANGALVQTGRRSASRFFWSRPLIVGFNEGRPGYGAAGLLADLRSARPAIVVLQANDWPLEPSDSASYFLSRPELATWLETGYVRQPDLDNFRIWLRRAS